MIVTWLTRVGGVLLTGIGCAPIVALLTAFVGFIPLIDPILRNLDGTAAMGVGVPIGMSTIALAWFAVRPTLRIGLIVAGFALVVLFKLIGAKGDDQEPGAAAT